VLATVVVNCYATEGGPDPPTNVQAHVVSSRSILVSWDESPPKLNMPTIAYSIHYAPTAGTFTLFGSVYIVSNAA